MGLLAVIPSRAMPERVPRTNTRSMHAVCLIVYTIHAA